MNSNRSLSIAIYAWGVIFDNIFQTRGCSPINVDNSEHNTPNIDWVMHSRRYDKGISLIWEYELQSDNGFHSNWLLSIAIDVRGASCDHIFRTRGCSPTNVDNTEHNTPNIDRVMNGRRYDKDISLIWEYELQYDKRLHSNRLLYISIDIYGASCDHIFRVKGCSPKTVENSEHCTPNIDRVVNSRKYDKGISLIWEYELQSNNRLHSNRSLSILIDTWGASHDNIFQMRGLSPINVDNSEHCALNIDWVMNGRRYDKGNSLI